MPEAPLSDAELIDIRALLGGTRSKIRITGTGPDESVRADHSGNNTAFAITQNGNSTAGVISNLSNNPCLTLHAFGNAAALQVIQDDGEDGIEALGSDIRCRQIISSLAANIAHTGGVRFSDSVSVLDASPDYFDVLTLNSSDDIVLGNTTRGYKVRIEVAESDTIEFKVGANVLMRIDSTGVYALTPVPDPINGEAIPITGS